MKGLLFVVFVISVIVAVIVSDFTVMGSTRICENATIYVKDKCYASKSPATLTNISVILVYSPGQKPGVNITDIQNFITQKTKSLLLNIGCDNCSLIRSDANELAGGDLDIYLDIDNAPIEFSGIRTQSVVSNWINGGRYSLPTRLLGSGGSAAPKGQSVQEKPTCAPGFEAITDERLCAECYFGYYIFKDLGRCLQCPRGTYQDETGQESCKICPDGYTTYYQGAILKEDCIESCEAGTFFNSQDETCEQCGYGKYQDKKDQTFCRTCPSGKTTHSTNATGADQCYEPCPAGKYLHADGSCQKCPVGTFREAEQERGCQPCPNGLTTETTGATNSSQCNTLVCTAGRYLVGGNPGECRLCPRHSYKTAEMTSCLSCGDQTRWRTDRRGATSKEECKFYCPAGSHIALMGDLQYCKGCPLDAYKEAKEYYAVRCSMCPEDRPRTKAENSTAFTDCRFAACGQGQVVNPTNSLECSVCDYDYYQPVKRPISEKCISCPSNTGTTIKGAKSSNDCKRFCPGGEELTGTEGCVKCSIGYYKSNAGSVDARFSRCRLCPNQLITEAEGTDSVDKCNIVNCTIGEYRDVDVNVCRPCPIGSFQDEIQQTSCKVCGFHNPGSSTIITGAKSVDDCYIYPEREWLRFRVKFDLDWNDAYWDSTSQLYQDLSKRLIKQVKPLLEELPIFSNKLQLMAFSLGSVNAHFQALFMEFTEEVEADLLDLLEGKLIIDNPGPLPTVNASGSAEVGYKRDDNDFPCKTGEYFNYGSGECEGCVVGSYQPEGAKEVCMSCPGGYSTTQAGLIGDRNSLCKLICPAGAEKGLTDVCVDCPTGSYKTARGIGSCLPCPGGRITERTGSDNSSECIQSCQAGSYGSFSNCTKCKKGWYQPEPGTSFCHQCPRNTKTTIEGAKKSNECLDVCTLGMSLCQNSATCVYDENSGDVSCLCSDRYEGEYCEFLIPDDDRETTAIIAALAVLFGLMAVGITVFCCLWCSRKTKKKREMGYFADPHRGRRPSTHSMKIHSSHQRASFSSVQEQHVIHVVQDPQPVMFQDPSGFAQAQFVQEPLAHQDVFFQVPQTTHWGNHEDGKMFVDPSTGAHMGWAHAEHRHQHGGHRHHHHGKKLRRYQYEPDQTAFMEDRRDRKHKKHKNKHKKQDKFATVASNKSEPHVYEEIDDYQRPSEERTETTSFSSHQTGSVNVDGPKLTDLETGKDLDKILSY